MSEIERREAELAVREAAVAEREAACARREAGIEAATERMLALIARLENDQHAVDRLLGAWRPEDGATLQ